MLPKVMFQGCQLIGEKIVTADVTLSANSFIFVKGIVYSPKGEPLSNTAIEVFLVDDSVIPAFEKSMGVTFTIENGSYGIALPRLEKYQYKLVAYASNPF